MHCYRRILSERFASPAMVTRSRAVERSPKDLRDPLTSGGGRFSVSPVSEQLGNVDCQPSFGSPEHIALHLCTGARCAGTACHFQRSQSESRAAGRKNPDAQVSGTSIKMLCGQGRLSPEFCENSGTFVKTHPRKCSAKFRFRDFPQESRHARCLFAAQG